MSTLWGDLPRSSGFSTGGEGSAQRFMDVVQDFAFLDLLDGQFFQATGVLSYEVHAMFGDLYRV